ncbi:hypothetical protein H5J25_13795 [Sphingomonas aliaeris]|uniref:Uncharacterized protein n=1 Tax=Sphingomonas aliaeris TaxID=2759526 RepID=A0A974NTB4_9SPHN|nr:hypothetical protein [Sphingomonas aliaeris]QQV76518.1 hypothetical protein H5J25_13795 [Sphingomonas aliaeris]
MNVAPWTVIGWIVVAILILSIIITPIALYVMTQRHRRWREQLDADWKAIQSDIQTGPKRSAGRFRL